MQITKDMTIGEVVNIHPEAATIMLKYGLHCVGCAVNPFESIESGCLGHGMDGETINNLVTDLNKITNKTKKSTDKIITLTDFAHEKFLQFMKEEGKNCYGVRVSAVINQNSTIEYNLEFADRPKNSEKVIEENGIKFFVESDVLNTVSGIEIDYVDNETGSGFKIDKHTESTGGCGTGCGCH